VVLPEEWDALADGMSLAHVAAKAVIKARRPELPVGLSLAMVDDQYVDDPSVRDRKRSEVYGRWLALASEDDFLGVQNYERVVYDGHGPVTPPSSAPRNQMGSAIEPLSLAGAVTYAYEAARVPILVTEHGMASADDTPRAAFLAPSLAGLLDTIEAGVPVLGYLHWTLLDNFEWIFGYTMHLGLVAVDRTTFARTPKPSAAVYAAIARANALPT
jgi:beta-glucosidase